MNTLLEIAQALLIIVGLVTVAVSIFLWFDRVSNQRRAKKALARQSLVEDMRKATQLSLLQAREVLLHSGVRFNLEPKEAMTSTHRLEIVLPRPFWTMDTNLIARTLVTLVKGEELFEKEQQANFGFVSYRRVLSNLLLKRADIRHHQVTIILMEMVNIDREFVASLRF